MCAARPRRRRSRLVRWVGKAAKSPWTVMVGSVTAIVAVVLAFTGPLVVIGSPVSTEPGALRIEPFPINDLENAEFVLPLDAPLEEMPHSAPCLPETVDWLLEHGVRRPPSYLMDIRNDADSGPMLTIDNVRVVDKKAITPQPGYSFLCPSQGAGETALLNLDLDRDGPAMLVDDETERPFAFNLEPGEQGSIDLRMHAATDGYSDRVVADVTGGGTTARVELPLGANGGRFEHPGLGKAAGFFVTADAFSDVFTCGWVNPDGSSGPEITCDAETVRLIVTDMWE